MVDVTEIHREIESLTHLLLTCTGHICAGDMALSLSLQYHGQVLRSDGSACDVDLTWSTLGDPAEDPQRAG